MDRESLKAQDLFYLRIKDIQVPVQFLGFEEGVGMGSRRLNLVRLDTGERIQKRNTMHLAAHSDACYARRGISTGSCKCQQELQTALLQKS